MTMKNQLPFLRLGTAVLYFFLLAVLTTPAWGVRVKDIAALRGARDNALIGFGIVVGLDGTGDSQESLLTRKPIVNALERIGISLNSQDILGRSIAAVWLTATLPPFAKSGQRLDITAATIGDAVSLRGGILIMTPLRGPDRLVYALGQGPIAGIPKGVSRAEAPLPSEELANLSIGSRMVASVGQIHGGAIVEREISLNLNSRARLYMNLHSPDFTTAFRLAKLINQNLGIRSARAQDAGTVEVSVPDSYLGNTVELLSFIENLEITPDHTAKVVLDERSGTVVMGGSVRISPIAISQNGLNIQVKLPTLNVEGTQGELTEGRILASSVFMLKGGTDLKEVVDGFNKIGASSRDLIEVLKAVKTAGALHAELVIR
ncbi:MAG: flagellar basal body P-ring protein FlgI [Deltaproteobacteria bacterium]|mgnify:FL=1|jgi:flagellar P-ring protein precursor FlgI|nr:flagellar basal body P-ring protein FlgI [Deltaproteobacteria bacterium]MBT5834959.1 flagellar basal body P-ring protein FlgI [Deltaproteobacteria bacterium]